MGCSSCAERAAKAAQYPREAVLPNGKRVTVTSAADERGQREAARVSMRREAAVKGYTATRR